MEDRSLEIFGKRSNRNSRVNHYLYRMNHKKYHKWRQQSTRATSRSSGKTINISSLKFEEIHKNRLLELLFIHY